jgi:multiple sugar transport system permease protein
MLYRKDLFDAAGVPYPQPGWTWEDLYAACRKISDPSRGVHGLQLAPGRQEAWSWQSFLSSTDDSRAAATALDFYTKLCTERWIDRHGRPQRGYVYKTDDPTKWDRGEIALSFSYIEERVFGTLDPDVTGMVPVPIGPRGQRGGEFNSRMMGLFAGIRELAVRDAAWEYLRWVDSPEAVALKLRVLVEGGMGRQINPKYLAMFGYDDLVQLAPKGWAETAQIAIDTGTPEPYGPNCSRIYDFMSVPLQRAEQLALHDKLPASEPARLEVLQSLLREAAAKANRELFGHVPAAERAARRLSAIVLLAVALVVGTVAAMRVAHSFRPTRFAEERRRARAYLLLVPAVVLVLVWQYLPLAWGSLLAFQDFRIMGGSRWVWLDNFGAALWNGDWWRTVWNTLRYSTLVMALTFLPPVGLALALQEVRRGGAVLRALYYMPAMISGLVTILLWRQFCDPSETGLLNSVWLRVPAIVFVALGVALAWIGWRIARRLWFHQCRWQAWLCLAAGVWLGYTCAAWAGPALARTDAAWWARLFLPAIEPRRWLTDPETALACCVLPLVWMGLGPGSLIYLAGLKSVGDELYEAGEIDGATTVDKVLFIVLPVLRPLLVINFIGVFIASWQSEASVLAMTGGAGDTEVAGLHIFYEAFLHLRFGPAAAMAWMLGFMLLGVMAQQLRLLGRAEFRTMGKGR